MTGDIVNLNKVRKAKAKREAQAAARAHRVKFGRGKGEKTANIIELKRAEKALEAHKREGDPPNPAEED